MLFQIDAEIILYNENDYVTIDTYGQLFVFSFLLYNDWGKRNALLGQ